REVMAWLQAKQESWGGKPYESHLRETSDHLLRYIEDLDAIRERVAVMQEELASKLAEQMTKTMYALTILAGVFLPLTFLTGLLGINVAGIPGSENSWAFVSVCVILAGITAAQIWVFAGSNGSREKTPPRRGSRLFPPVSEQPHISFPSPD
ncbi:MAG: hypothetical protein OEY80_02980, partial [Nitrospirota bacterium]|nr:hypothetical protein [Nitrospirota bacterium]